MTSDQSAANEVFVEAQRMVTDLDNDMRTWDLATTIEELKKAIRTIKSTRKIRDFSRRYLGLSGSRYTKVREWLADPSSMTAEDISKILRGIQKLRRSKSNAKLRTHHLKSCDVPPKRDVKRRVIAHTITLLNSLNFLIAEADIQPKDAFDGERMNIRDALQKMCARFGIPAAFSDRKRHGDQPLTSKDLTDIGLKLKGQRK